MHIVDLARAGELSLVEQALHKGEGVNSRCFRNGSTPLIAAAAQGHLPLVKLLLDANADVNAINHDLATALIAASPLTVGPSDGEVTGNQEPHREYTSCTEKA